MEVIQQFDQEYEIQRLRRWFCCPRDDSARIRDDSARLFKALM